MVVSSQGLSRTQSPMGETGASVKRRVAAATSPAPALTPASASGKDNPGDGPGCDGRDLVLDIVDGGGPGVLRRKAVAERDDVGGDRGREAPCFGLRFLDAAENVSTAMHVDEGWERAGGQRPVDAGAARAGAGVEHHVLDRGEPRLGLGLAQDRVHPAVMALLFHRLFGAGRNGMFLLERDEPRHQGLGFGMDGHRGTP